MNKPPDPLNLVNMVELPRASTPSQWQFPIPQLIDLKIKYTITLITANDLASTIPWGREFQRFFIPCQNNVLRIKGTVFIRHEGTTSALRSGPDPNRHLSMSSRDVT